MKLTIMVEQEIEVEVDESKFDEKFMEEFRKSFYQLDDIEDHMMHIAQLQARGIIDLSIIPEFIEGYGPSQDMGIKAKVVGGEEYICERHD